MRSFDGPVLVTGASGFIGAHVAARLQATGVPVRLTSRRPRRGEHAPSDIIAADLATDSLLPLVRGIDSVVHLAGRAHVHTGASRDEAAFIASNVQATSRLAAAAADAGVRRFIFMSSIAAVRSRSDNDITEDTRPSPTTAYGRSKLAAEEALQRITEGTQMELMILRPTTVYGPGMRGNPFRLMQLVLRGVPLPFASIRNARSFVFIDTVVDAVAALCASPAPVAGTFLVADDDLVSTPGFVREFAAAADVRPRLFSCPPQALRAAGVAAEIALRLRLASFGQDAMSGLLDSLPVRATRLRDRLSVRPRYGFAEGVRKTVAAHLRGS